MKNFKSVMIILTIVFIMIALYFNAVIQVRESREVKVDSAITETIITETEVYRMSCTEIRDNVCTEYVLKRINKD